MLDHTETCLWKNLIPIIHNFIDIYNLFNVQFSQYLAKFSVISYCFYSFMSCFSSFSSVFLSFGGRGGGAFYVSCTLTWTYENQHSIKLTVSGITHREILLSWHKRGTFHCLTNIEPYLFGLAIHVPLLLSVALYLGMVCMYIELRRETKFVAFRSLSYRLSIVPVDNRDTFWFTVDIEMPLLPEILCSDVDAIRENCHLCHDALWFFSQEIIFQSHGIIKFLYEYSCILLYNFPLSFLNMDQYE